MADRWTALNTFWNSFDLPAYDENTVPDEATLPYITYEAKVSQIEEYILLTASLWYRSESWEEISLKADQIDHYIEGGAGVHYDGGRLWITKALPFAQRMDEPDDRFIRRIVLQITAEYQ